MPVWVYRFQLLAAVGDGEGVPFERIHHRPIIAMTISMARILISIRMPVKTLPLLYIPICIMVNGRMKEVMKKSNPFLLLAPLGLPLLLTFSLSLPSFPFTSSHIAIANRSLVPLV